jgi:hypothetical protein
MLDPIRSAEVLDFRDAVKSLAGRICKGFAPILSVPSTGPVADKCVYSG